MWAANFWVPVTPRVNSSSISGMAKLGRTITLVVGGARSGKSRHAQELAARFRRVVFIATARALDGEMRSKIARHRRERPATWKTVEAFVRLPEAIRSQSKNADVLLIDCFTLYVSSAMRLTRGAEADNQKHVSEICDAIRSSRSSVIAVSNEVGSGIVPALPSARVYGDLLGKLNQEVASIADNVVLMVAGLPIHVKGSGRIARVRA
jgi:adenosylcobinamide kinase / adenosylcobinamide-phosphate guanylyltransferase